MVVAAGIAAAVEIVDWNIDPVVGILDYNLLRRISIPSPNTFLRAAIHRVRIPSEIDEIIDNKSEIDLVVADSHSADRHTHSHLPSVLAAVHIHLLVPAAFPSHFHNSNSNAAEHREAARSSV